MSTVAIIDRFPLIRMGLNILLDEHFSEAKIIAVSHVNELAKDVEADLFILGIDVDADDDGQLMIAQFKSKFPWASLIVFGEGGLPAMTMSNLTDGVKGFISKQSSIEELATCIGTVLYN